MRLLIVGLSSLILSACNPFVDDQSHLPDVLYKIANPTPTQRDYKSINNKHKILVGVIDSGVDYNHPQLQKSMHFDLDENDKPIGIGWDYLGQDPWTSPNLVRNLNNSNTIPDALAEISTLNRKLIERAIEIYPELLNKISPDRLLEGEIDSSAYHGTHVAGILADDESLIGIVPYRIMPLVRLSEKNSSIDDVFEDLFDKFLDAHQKAYEKGIRILNISMLLGTEIDSRKIRITPALFKKKLAEYRVFLDEHPDLLIVAASGNNSKDLANHEFFQMPCGLRHSQVLCVGSVDSSKRVSSFSNTFSNYENFVTSEGQDVWSSYPTNFCDTEFYTPGFTIGLWTIPTVSSIFRKLSFTEKEVFKNCGYTKKMHLMSGTSMATPKVTQEAALVLLKNPGYGPNDIIAYLKSHHL